MFINPFEEAELTSLSSGIIQTEKALTDLMEAEKIGEKELVNFQQERLYSDEVNFYDPIKKLKLGTFSKLITKAVKIKSSGKIAQFSVQSNIFGKIALIQHFYPLGPVPWSLASCSGELVKTSKSALMHHLEKNSNTCESVQKPFAAIFDGMDGTC